MLRNVPLVSIYIGVLLVTIGSTQAAQYGTADEAKAMLGRAIAAVKQDEANALDHFNKGDNGFKDRDLYVFSPMPQTASSQRIRPVRVRS